MRLVLSASVAEPCKLTVAPASAVISAPASTTGASFGSPVPWLTFIEIIAMLGDVRDSDPSGSCSRINRLSFGSPRVSAVIGIVMAWLWLSPSPQLSAPDSRARSSSSVAPANISHFTLTAPVLPLLRSTDTVALAPSSTKYVWASKLTLPCSDSRVLSRTT